VGEACEAVAGGSSWGVGCVRGRFVRSFVRPFVRSFVRSFVQTESPLRCRALLFVVCSFLAGVSSSKWRVVGVSSKWRVVEVACRRRVIDRRVIGV